MNCGRCVKQIDGCNLERPTCLEVREAADLNGCQFVGLQEGCGEVPNMWLVNDLETGTTFTLEEGLTVETTLRTVAKRLAEIRAAYRDQNA
jgi:hypothetical protein